MDFRPLGSPGLRVPALSFGAWDNTDGREARRLVDICLEAGVTMFDSGDFHYNGRSAEVLGEAIKSRRDQVIVSTRTALPVGDGPNDAGGARAHLKQASEAALRRLGTDYIDLLQLHAFEAATPIGEVLSTLDELVRTGRVRYVGVSNSSGWHLMKSLAVAEKYGYPRYIAHQVDYSLVGRDYERELMPLGLDQGVGALVRDPLGWGRLRGKVRRSGPLLAQIRLHQTADNGPPVDEDVLYRVVHALDGIAIETGKTIPQIAINWLLQRPTVSSVIIGARNEEELRQNLGAVGWTMTPEQLAKLKAASEVTAPYPYFPYRRQVGFARLNPPAA